MKPGIVLSSLMKILISAVRKKSTRAMPSQPSARKAFAVMSRMVASTSGGNSAGTLSAAPPSSRYFAS